MIEIENVSIGYDGKKVIHNINLNIPEKGITVLVGPNGAGKSTLLCGIGRLLPLETGNISIDGIDLKKWKNDQLAKRMAVLRQDNYISMRLTVSELVLLGRYPHTKGNTKAEDYEIAEKAIKQVDMLDLAKNYIDEISGGQRQRAFIAMTLAQNAKYLLLDEPLSALDMRHSRDMMRYLYKISRGSDISVLIVIHDINMAAAYADHIVALKDGNIVATGSPEEVMNEKILSDVFNCQVSVAKLENKFLAFPQW